MEVKMVKRVPKAIIIYEGGEILFKEGEKADKIFIIKKGIVEFCKNDGEASDIRAQLFSGSVIGALDFLRGGKYFYTARVKVYAEVKIIERDELKNILKREPKKFIAIITGLMNEAHALRSQLEEVIQSNEFSGKEWVSALESGIVQEAEKAEDAEKSLASVVEMVSTLTGVNFKLPPKKYSKLKSSRQARGFFKLKKTLILSAPS